MDDSRSDIEAYIKELKDKRDKLRREIEKAADYWNFERASRLQDEHFKTVSELNEMRQLYDYQLAEMEKKVEWEELKLSQRSKRLKYADDHTSRAMKYFESRRPNINDLKADLERYQSQEKHHEDSDIILQHLIKLMSGDIEHFLLSIKKDQIHIHFKKVDDDILWTFEDVPSKHPSRNLGDLQKRTKIVQHGFHPEENKLTKVISIQEFNPEDVFQELTILVYTYLYKYRGSEDYLIILG